MLETNNTIKTELGVEVYENSISEYLDQYIHEKNIQDMHKEPQSRWNAALLYIYKNYFKLHPDILKSEDRTSNTYDLDIINDICDIYIDLCYEYDKEISILGFCKLTGMVQDTIYQWGAESSRPGTSASEGTRRKFIKYAHIQKKKSGWIIRCIKQALWLEYGTA